MAWYLEGDEGLDAGHLFRRGVEGRLGLPGWMEYGLGLEGTGFVVFF